MAESSAALTAATEGTRPVLSSLHEQPDQEQALVTDLKSRDSYQSMDSAGFKEDSIGGSGNQMENTIRAIGDGMKAACLQWEQLMVESEQFELFCPTRVDKLLQEAQAMEAHLLHQKEQLISRLRKLSQTLQVVP